MNTKAKIAATFFIILFLVLLALIVYMVMGNLGTSGDSAAQYSSQMSGALQSALSNDGSSSAQSAVTPAPVVTTAPAAVTPVPTYVPTAAPSATPAPTSTPAPTVTPEPAGISLGSGTFTSDTGTYLNLKAVWSAVTKDASHVTVTVTAYATSYALNCTSYPSLYITVNGSTQNLQSPAIDYTGSTLADNELGSATFTIDLAQGQTITLPMSVRWNFNGVYGVDANGNPNQLDTIEAELTTSLVR